MGFNGILMGFYGDVSLPEGNENTDAVFCCLFFFMFLWMCFQYLWTSDPK